MEALPALAFHLIKRQVLQSGTVVVAAARGSKGFQRSFCHFQPARVAGLPVEQCKDVTHGGVGAVLVLVQRVVFNVIEVVEFFCRFQKYVKGFLMARDAMPVVESQHVVVVRPGVPCFGVPRIAPHEFLVVGPHAEIAVRVLCFGQAIHHIVHSLLQSFIGLHGIGQGRACDVFAGKLAIPGHVFLMFLIAAEVHLHHAGVGIGCLEQPMLHVGFKTFAHRAVESHARDFCRRPGRTCQCGKPQKNGHPCAPPMPRHP